MNEYFKALLDFRNYLETNEPHFEKKTYKVYKNFVISSLDLLLTNSYRRDKWREVGGSFDDTNTWIKPDGTVFGKDQK